MQYSLRHYEGSLLLYAAVLQLIHQKQSFVAPTKNEPVVFGGHAAESGATVLSQLSAAPRKKPCKLHCTLEAFSSPGVPALGLGFRVEGLEFRLRV